MENDMTVGILSGTFIAAGVVLFILSYLKVERNKGISEKEKTVWYKKILIPWILSGAAGCFGAFLMHKEYCQSLENTIVVHKNWAHLWLKPEMIPSRWQEMNEP